ncbi:MAG: hypothetical protein WC004_02670 [Candidatus Absconditabacterales bacterium]
MIHPNKDDVAQSFLATQISGTLSGERTWIDFDNIEDKDTVFGMARKLITQEIVDYEYAIFNEEFGNIRYGGRVIEKHNKSVYGESWSKKPRPFSLEAIQAYHDHHIKQGKYVLLDEHTNTIVEHNFEDKELSIKDVYNIPEIKYTLLYLEGQKNFILQSESFDANTLVYFHFLGEIIESRDSFHKRYQLESYYTHGATSYYTTSYCSLRTGPHCTLDITEEFFDQQKQYFLRDLEKGSYPSLFVISMLYNNEKFNNKAAIDLIHSISFDNYKTVVQNIKNLF